MHRRDFLKASGVGLAGLALPFGNVIAAEELLTSLDVGMKKSISDAAMQAARDAGATYCDVRIGRYLRQFVMTREDKVENVVSAESTGVGVRVIANGAWGFAATSQMSPDAVAQAEVGGRNRQLYLRTGTALAPDGQRPLHPRRQAGRARGTARAGALPDRFAGKLRVVRAGGGG